MSDDNKSDLAKENAILRELLKSALGDLDTIAPDLTGVAPTEELMRTARNIAESGSRYVRQRLRQEGLRL